MIVMSIAVSATNYGFVPSNLKVVPTSAEINFKLQVVFQVADR